MLTAVLLIIVVIAIVFTIAVYRRQSIGGPNQAWPVHGTTTVERFAGPIARPVEHAASREKAIREPFHWAGPAETLDVQGFRISNPLTYVGSIDPGNREPSQIDRSLPVKAETNPTPLPYWPSYSSATLEQRHTYLTWLASDRRGLPPGDGFLFIYYYGLERRILVEKADLWLIFNEVERLRRLHAAHSPCGPRGSFQHYTSGLLWHLVSVYGTKFKADQVQLLAQCTQAWKEEWLGAALAWFVNRELPLPAWLAFIFAAQSPLSQRSVVRQRVNQEFEKLFAQRYQNENGDGLLMRSAKRHVAIQYRPASAVLSPTSVVLPHPMGVQSQFRPLSEIWNTCICDLRRFSNVMKKQPAAGTTAETWEAMPLELRSRIDHPYAASIYDVVARTTDDQGYTFVNVGEFAKLFHIDEKSKLTVKQSRSIATTVEFSGFVVEPDVRLMGGSYEWDELLAVFPNAFEGECDPKRYRAAAYILRLGVEIAEADERVDDREIHGVLEHIENTFQMNEYERRRLKALHNLLAKTGSDITGLGRRLQAELTDANRGEIGRLLVAVAGADGVITKQELVALHRCYRALGLSDETLDDVIRGLTATAQDGPVTVIPAMAGPLGEHIPPSREKQEGLRLDQSLIRQIMAESKDVSVMLAQAMGLDDQINELLPHEEGPRSVAIVSTGAEPIESPCTTTPDTPTREGENDGFPPQIADFYRALASQEKWSRNDAEMLARNHGYMLAGALEAINDWAFDRIGNQLIHEENDCVVIDRDLLEATKKYVYKN